MVLGNPQELQEPQELKRVYDVCKDELQRMGTEILDKLWTCLDNPFGEDLKSLKIEVNSLNPEILEEEKWDDLSQLFERVCVKDGPMLKISKPAKHLDDTLKEIEKIKKVIVVNLIADDSYSSKVSPIRKFNDQCKLFLAVMAGMRLAKRQFPSKKTKGEISASLREFWKFVDREKIHLGQAFKDWMQEAASDAERKSLVADAAVPAAGST